MQVFDRIINMKKYVAEQKKQGKTIGFVPTMGFLHEGHTSLIKKSASENDITIISIFVNPTQFGVKEDFSSYPRNFERDYELAEGAGAVALFYPEEKEMYPKDFATYINVENLTEGLCGASRPTHFRGVTTVVLKLFNIVSPHRAYFGQKDAQQLAVIKKMTADLNLDISIIGCPIIREESGLAKSSRNVYLTDDERTQATALFNSLNFVKNCIEQGEKSAIMLKKEITKKIESQAPLAKVDYVEIVDADNLTELAYIEGKILIALAVRFPSARLIDNIIISV